MDSGRKDRVHTGIKNIMQENQILLTIIMPALNEEANILHALNNTLEAFTNYNIDGEVIVVNDGSKDKTYEMVSNLILQYPDKVRVICHDSPEGIGASFWDGVENANGEIVCMLPGDNENDPLEILRYMELLRHVDIVVPFIYNRWSRSLFRNILSLVYRIIINTTFGVNLNYTNGTVLYRKSVLKDARFMSKGFFFQTDILIRLIKKGYLFAEVPYRLGLRKSGVSKAISFPSLLQVIKGYLLLIQDIYFASKVDKDTEGFSADSLSAKRYGVHKK